MLEGEPTIVVDGVDHPLRERLLRPARRRSRSGRSATTAKSLARILIVWPLSRAATSRWIGRSVGTGGRRRVVSGRSLLVVAPLVVVLAPLPWRPAPRTAQKWGRGRRSSRFRARSSGGSARTASGRSTVYDDELEHPRPAASSSKPAATRLDEVGPPPSERLQAAADRAVEACPLPVEKRGRSGGPRTSSRMRTTPDAALPRHGGTWLSAEPRADESRADLVLSGLASRIADSRPGSALLGLRRTGVVCCEVNAWAVDSDDAERPLRLAGQRHRPHPHAARAVQRAPPPSFAGRHGVAGRRPGRGCRLARRPSSTRCSTSSSPTPRRAKWSVRLPRRLSQRRPPPRGVERREQPTRPALRHRRPRESLPASTSWRAPGSSTAASRRCSSSRCVAGRRFRSVRISE